MVLGFALAYLFYIRRTDLPRKLAAQHWPLYQFLLNKWYFDELYDLIFVSPAMWLGRFLWKKGDGWLIDGFGPDGVSARVVDVTQRRGPAADRLCLPLCLRHADRRRRPCDLVHVRGRALMSGWPILSVVTFLPLVGAAFILVDPRR